MAEKASGWASLAYENDMVLLFPQTTLGCYDHNDEVLQGYKVSGDLQGTNQGVQEQAIMAMVQRLMEPADHSTNYLIENYLRYIPKTVQDAEVYKNIEELKLVRPVQSSD